MATKYTNAPYIYVQHDTRCTIFENQRNARNTELHVEEVVVHRRGYHRGANSGVRYARPSFHARTCSVLSHEIALHREREPAAAALLQCWVDRSNTGVLRAQKEVESFSFCTQREQRNEERRNKVILVWFT